MKRLRLLALSIIFSFCFNSSFLYSADLRGSEPTREQEIPGYSEIIEPVDAPVKPRFHGETKWRFRSDKPNAETFGSQPYFTNPLYLYNRTLLFWNFARGSKTALDFVLLRRDETTTGGSEPPINADTAKKGYFLKHVAGSFQSQEQNIFFGDIFLGWGQGLAFAKHPGSPYRPFLLKSHRASAGPNRSSYENIGLRGLAYQCFWNDWNGLASLARTPLDGRLASNGEYIEDLLSVRDTLYGELGRTLDFQRRDTINELAAIGRLEKTTANIFWGVSFAALNYSKAIHPQPNITVNALPNDSSQVFQGRDAQIVSWDISWVREENQEIVSETAFSRWGNHLAPALVIAMRLKSESRKSSYGVFHLDPFFVSRHGDGVRLNSGKAANRQGAFTTQGLKVNKHDLGFQFYLERNLKSNFSGSNLSHSSPYPRWFSWLRLDDQWGIYRNWFLYLRSEASREPYLVHASNNPDTPNLWDLRYRGEISRQRQFWRFALGFDWARGWASRYPEQKTEGKAIYFNSSTKFLSDSKFYGRLAIFDLGNALFSNRFLYMSSPEMYWRDLWLSSIAYQSLFASYAPKGTRLALALEQTLMEGLSFWVKTGATILSKSILPSAPSDASERDDRIARVRLDFKTEITLKW